MTATLWAILLRPIFNVIFFFAIVAPIAWLLYRVFPEGREVLGWHRLPAAQTSTRAEGRRCITILPHLYYIATAMPISVRLPPRVEQRLAEYCAHAKLTKSEAVKRALERLFEQEAAPAAANPMAKRFVGSDKREGDIARNSKRLLRQRFRGK